MREGRAGRRTSPSALRALGPKQLQGWALTRLDILAAEETQRRRALLQVAGGIDIMQKRNHKIQGTAGTASWGRRRLPAPNKI